MTSPRTTAPHIPDTLSAGPPKTPRSSDLPASDASSTRVFDTLTHSLHTPGPITTRDPLGAARIASAMVVYTFASELRSTVGRVLLVTATRCKDTA